MTAAMPIPDHQSPVGAEFFEMSARRWRDAQLAAALLAVDPVGLGGARIRSAPGPVRDHWMTQFRSLLPKDAPLVKLPFGADSARILGGLDLTATLRTGRPVSEKGLMANADGGVLVAPMAERMTPAGAALIAAAMDDGAVAVENSGVSRRDATHFCCILFDEGIDPSEGPPQLLIERIAFHVDLDAVSSRAASSQRVTAAEIETARGRLNHITCPDEIAEAIASSAAALNVHSLRALLFTIRAACAAAALEARDTITLEDAEIGCRLVLGPRAMPDAAPPEASEPQEEQHKNDTESDASNEDGSPKELEDILLAAVRAAALSGLLEKPAQNFRRRVSAGAGGKSGAIVDSTWKGRPVGARPGLPRDGARLDLPATLRAAAPWSKIRHADSRAVRLPIYADDIRIKRFKARSETVVIFAVDASGSSAMQRMAEAKGAVELLLSDCYSRRDHVALIAFRGEKADLLLPPTRSLTRVRRTLSALPGGGGTPLAAGVAMAAALAETEKRKGKTPFVVILSDGRGNIALSGAPDRAAADADVINAAQRLRQTGCTVLFFDTANRPSPRAQALSAEIGARYLPLPFADSAAVSKSVKQAVAAGS